MEASRVLPNRLSGGQYPAGNPAPWLGGLQGEGIVTELHGKYFVQADNQKLFFGSTAAAGVVIPIYTTLTPTFSLWNPAGSGVDLELIRLTLGWTATTAALGTIGYAYTAGAGSTIGSTAPFVAFGAGTPVCGKGPNDGVSLAKFAGGGTTTLVAAPTWFRGSGLSTGATTAATTTMPMWMANDDFDGQVIVEPGNAIHVVGSTAVLMTATMTLSWVEKPH